MSGKKTDIVTKEKAVKSEESVKAPKVAAKPATKTTKSAKPTEKKAAEKTVEKKANAAKSAEKKTTAAKSEKAVEKKPAAQKSAKSSVEKKPTARAAKGTAKQSEAVKSATKKTDEKQTGTPKATAGKTSKAAAKKAPAKAADAKSGKGAAAKTADTAEKKPAKSRKKAEPKEEPKTGEPSSKTPQVMKLVQQQKNDMLNPTIIAGKSSIPRRLRGLEPLSRIMKREAEAVFGGDEAETYNLTALVIDDHAAEILRRFNSCDCELCVETLSRLTAEVVPARFVKLRKRDVEFESPAVKQLKEPLQKIVTSRMVRLVMQNNKKRSYHE